MLIATGCTLMPRAERVWLEKETNLFQTARGVEIGFYDVATSNWWRFAVTNEGDLASLREALPRSYMKRARHIESSTFESDGTSIAVHYPLFGTLTTNGSAYPASCIFISTNGLVVHGRGNLRDPNWHGALIPKYKEAAVNLCLKYGMSSDKLGAFQQAPGTRR